MNTIDTAVYMADLGVRARAASRETARAGTAAKDQALRAIARRLREQSDAPHRRRTATTSRRPAAPATILPSSTAWR